MKKIFYFLILILLTGCNDFGKSKLVFNMTYKATESKTTAKQGIAAIKSNVNEEHYTQFGDFITSITPKVFIGKFLEMRLLHYIEGETNWKEQILIIDSNMDWASDKRLADFSNNATVQISPRFEGVDFKDMTNVEFNLFANTVMFFYQEFEIPAEYENTRNFANLSFGGDLDLTKPLIGGERDGRIIKIGNQQLMDPIFNSSGNNVNGNFSNVPQSYVFGSTDSTYLFYNEKDHNPGINDPIGQGGWIIRSNAYHPFSLGDMSGGITKTINGVIAFNTTDLIQIYAGKDNIPYNSDDIFVYAPKFWERISVNLVFQ